MALHNLKIIVVDGGKSNSYKSKNSGSKKSDYKNTSIYKLFHLKEEMQNKFKSGMTPSAVFAMNKGMQVVSYAAKQTASYFINDIGRKNGDASLQEHINREIEIASDTIGMINNSFSGAATGSMFGPTGVLIGAVAGITTTAISLVFKHMERNREFNFKEFKENNSIEYQRARASINLTTGRLR